MQKENPDHHDANLILKLYDLRREGLFLYVKVLPHLERFRKEISPTAFQNAEWISTQCAEGRKSLEMIQLRVRKMMEAK